MVAIVVSRSPASSAPTCFSNSATICRCRSDNMKNPSDLAPSESRLRLRGYEITPLMNFRLRDRRLALEKIEVAALVGLADVLGKHRAVAAQVMRRRRRPGGAPARQLLLADMQMDAARGDVDFDLVARRGEGERGPH